MVFIRLEDYQVGTKHYCGLQNLIIIHSIWIKLEFHQNALEKEIIHQETPLLTSVENVPYLQNVCCNEGNRNVLQYFIEKNQSIGANNGQVHEFSNIYNSYKKLSKAKTLYDPTDTKLSYPPVDKTIFSDESIYKAFIYYFII